MQDSLLHSTPVHRVQRAQVWPLGGQDAVHRVFAVLPRYMHRHAVGLAHRYRIGRLTHDLQGGKQGGQGGESKQRLGQCRSMVAGQRAVPWAHECTGNTTHGTCQPAAAGHRNI